MVHIDLGRLELKSDVSGLQLELSSAAQFAPSAEDDIALQAKLNDGRLNVELHCSPWISRGNNFRLELSLQIDCELEAVRQDALVEILTANLRSAPLWKSLSLSPISLESSHVSTGHHLVTVFLDHEEHKAPRTKRRLHKLQADVPFHDVDIPAGIRTAVLDSVRLDMCIKIAPRKRKWLKRHSSTSDSSAHVSQSLRRASSDFGRLENEFFDAELSHSSSPGGNISKFDAAVWHSECGDEDTSHEDPAMLLGTKDEHVSRAVHSYLQTDVLTERPLTEALLELDDHRRSTEAILHLVDAAIRLSISDSQKRLANGISVAGTESLKRLADIAPSLWSPDYLPEFASRAVFLPTISHALSSVCCRHAKTDELKAKARELSQLKTNGDSGMLAPRVRSDDFVSLPESLLWRIIHRGLYSSDAGRTLGLIAAGTKAAFADSSRRDEILDPSPQSYHCAERSDEEHDDLLFDGDEDNQDCKLHEDLFEFEEISEVHRGSGGDEGTCTM